MATNSLAKIINELKKETDSLKATQIIGYDDSVCYEYEYTIEKTLSDYYLNYTFTFTGTQAFPLMVISLQIYENGVLKPNPKDGMYAYNGPGYSDMNSICSYLLADSNTAFSEGFVPPLKPTNVRQQTLSINRSGSAPVALKIIAKIKTTYPGYVTITEGITN